MAEDMLKNTVYNGEQCRWDFEKYVNDFFASLEPWEAEMLSRTHFQADVFDTAAAILLPSIVACDHTRDRCVRLVV